MADKDNIAELSDLGAALRCHGMLIRGGFALTEDDEQGLAGFPDLASAMRGRTLVLIGNAGPALYEAFFAAGESGGDNPLDDWTRRVVLPIADLMLGTRGKATAGLYEKLESIRARRAEQASREREPAPAVD